MVELFEVPRLPEYAAAFVLVLAALAEWLHQRRVRRIAYLAFGPTRRPAAWARAVPALVPLAAAAAVWGFATLCAIEPRSYSAVDGASQRPGDMRHALIALDVSPSMRLVDAGPDRDKSRMERARAIVESFFDRVPLERYRISVVAFYTGAKPVVVETQDFEVVRNILGDLPMHYAFSTGRTALFEGLAEAAKVAGRWNPSSATLIVLTDGDTVPPTGMPRMPASIRSTIVVGVGDPDAGTFIEGRQSRQDVATLKQVAARLGGEFHNGNTHHLASRLIADATGLDQSSAFERLTLREYALLALLLGTLWLALVPFLLEYLGTTWRPGVRPGVRPSIRASGAAGSSSGVQTAHRPRALFARSTAKGNPS